MDREAVIKLLENVYIDTVDDLFIEFPLEETLSLIEHTQMALLGLNNESDMSVEKILELWSRFIGFYSAACYTGKNLYGIKIAHEEDMELKNEI
jgi:hypothetical protein